VVGYVITVAVQTAAGRHDDAAAHRGHRPADHVLREPAGVGENGKTFTLPACLFSASVGLMIIVAVAREAFGGACRMSHGKRGRCRSGTTPAACLPSRPYGAPGDGSPGAVAPFLPGSGPRNGEVDAGTGIYSVLPGHPAWLEP
jgi:hypothetical protein